MVVVILLLLSRVQQRPVTVLNHLPRYSRHVRIVVVGNGPSVMARERGDWIDAHDVVVRFNAAPPRPRYTGVRTSVHVVSGGYLGPTLMGASRIVVLNHPLFRFRRSCETACLVPPYRGATNVMTYLTHLCRTHPHNEITLVGVDDIDWQNVTYEEAHYFSIDVPEKPRWNRWTDRVAMKFHRRETVELEELLRAHPNMNHSE